SPSPPSPRHTPTPDTIRPRMDRAKKIAVWVAPEQIPLIRDAARVADTTIVAAGSPARGQSGGVASDLEAKSMDDLRAMLASAEADLVLIGDPGAFGAESNQADASAVQAARARGVKIATLEPIPGAGLVLVSGGWPSRDGGPSPTDAIRFCPLARLAAPFREATEVLENFGHIRTVAVEAWCSPREGSLGARLYGGLELILA